MVALSIVPWCEWRLPIKIPHSKVQIFQPSIFANFISIETLASNEALPPLPIGQTPTRCVGGLPITIALERRCPPWVYGFWTLRFAYIPLPGWFWRKKPNPSRFFGLQTPRRLLLSPALSLPSSRRIKFLTKSHIIQNETAPHQNHEATHRRCQAHEWVGHITNDQRGKTLINRWRSHHGPSWGFIQV